MGKPLLLLFTFIASSYCNSIPVIDSMSIIPVNEDLQEGDFAFQILAHDDDNDPLTYSIKGQYSIHFNVNNTTGEVRIASRLDREVKDVLPITLVVNDGVYADETKNVHVAVQDANDNAPQFVGLPYNLEVPENLTVGSTIFTAGATDADFGTSAVVSYKIVEVVPNDGTGMFDISETKGDIILRESFNFTEKSPFYQIRINASDGGGLFEGIKNYTQSTIVTAFLTIKDVPDLNPQFLNLPNSATVYEKSPVDTPVFTVKARDPDTGINDKIRYSIKSELDLFQINEDTGIISVKTEFDRENVSKTIVELEVKASETQPNVNGVIASTLGKLQITIGDINDNGPDFYKCDDACNVTHSFTGSVDENPSAGVSVADLQITVKDPDQGENHAKFNLRLEGDDKDAFSVNPSSGVESSLVQVIIKNPTAIDFEKKPTMIVQIVATDANDDARLSTTATVTININDLNDNFPKFENDTYTFSINEHCEVGTVVATITATDADALDDGKITYHLVPPSMLDIFGIFEHNGTIYVKDRSKLDREITSSYSPTLQAKDSDGKISTTVVEIKILDINDQTPEMNRDIYEVFVDEDKDFRLQIQARDGDEPETPNSEIQYSIEDSTFSSNFSIDQKTGLLVNNGLLDREAIDHKLNGEIELTVIASDKGTPSRSSNATVKVNIGDVNDNSPKFLDNSYTFKVKESEKGILVGSVRAHDADQTDFNNRIFFNIIDGSFGSFIIYSEQYSEGYRGNITVDPAKELDYESEFKSFTLEVEASDLDKQKTVTTVEVEVLDVNDTPPKFPAGLTLTVKENTSLPGSLSTIEGTDVDTLHSLDYELISSKCRCNGTTGPCPEEWFMVGHNGDVTVNSEYVIDYEACDQVSLTARVIDLLTEKGSNSSEGVVTINIEDINDNAPEFIIIQEFYVVLLERVEKGSAVAKVYAYDRDTGNNRKTEFKVVKVEFINSEGTKPQDLFFYADSGAQEDSLGIFSTDIRSQKSMDSNQRGKFRVEVEASNPDGVSSTSVVELLTVDTSYRVSLRFRSSVSEVNANLAQIRGILTGATKATVHIFNVFSEAATRAEEITVLEAYFVFPNGTALNYDDVNTILNSEEVYVEYGVLLVQLGFTGISTTTEDKKEVKPEVYIMIGLVAALAIVLVVTTTSLVFIRRNYKRKLKASKAMNSAATVVIENQKTGPVVPGTNKYTKEGANPVLNMNIDTATDLGFDEDGSSADRESLNSLDYNIDMAEKDSMPMMVIEEEDEDEDRESPYIEPLGAALAQRGENRGSDSPSLTFENPSMNTTDL